MSFEKFGLRAETLRAVKDLGFDTPTPIQRDAIPPGLEDRDVLACAMTGSGKTAAFLIPIIERLIDAPAPRRGEVRALVVAPTRELAAQIDEHFVELARHTKLTSTCVFGGVGMGPQEKAFRRGVDLMVACPGRLLDHLSRPYASLDAVEVLVLDEADRMLDMGFLPDIRRILGQLPKDRQNLLFSATMPREITKLSSEILYEPVAIDVGRPSKPADGVAQSIWPVPERIKKELLLELLRRDVVKNAIVFTRTKHRANRLAGFLEKQGIIAERIHGNRSQAQRTRALAEFKAGRCQILVATDIAARGIDVEALSHVINFDIPNVPDDYIHRVGRTARADATGDAITFVTDTRDDQDSLRGIERAIRKKLPRRQLDDFDYRAPETERFEVPLKERLAEMRAQRSRGRQRRGGVPAGSGGGGGSSRGRSRSPAGGGGGGGERRGGARPSGRSPGRSTGGGAPAGGGGSHGRRGSRGGRRGRAQVAGSATG